MNFLTNKEHLENILSKIKDKSFINKNLPKLLNSIGVEDFIGKENCYYNEDLSFEDFKTIINQNNNKPNNKILQLYGKLKDNNLSVIYCKRLISKNNFDQNELVDFLLDFYYENFIDLTKEIDLTEENIKKYINKNENPEMPELVKNQKNIDFLFNNEELFKENFLKYIRPLTSKKNLSIELTKKLIIELDNSNLQNYKKDLFEFMPLNNEIIDLCFSNEKDNNSNTINNIIKNNNMEEKYIKYIIENYNKNNIKDNNISMFNKLKIKVKLSKEFLIENIKEVKLSKEFLIENIKEVNEVTIINSLSKKEKELKEVLKLKIRLEESPTNNKMGKKEFYKFLQGYTYFDLDLYSEILKLNGESLEDLEKLELHFLNNNTSKRNWKKILNKLDSCNGDEKKLKAIISNIQSLENITIPDFILDKYFHLFMNKKNSDISDFFESDDYFTDDEYVKYEILHTQLIPKKYKSDKDFLKSFTKKDIAEYLKNQDLNQEDYEFLYDNVLKNNYNEDELEYYYLKLLTNKNYISKLNKEEFYKLLKSIYEINKKEKYKTIKYDLKNIDFGYINYIHSYFVEEGDLINKIKLKKEIDYGISI